MLRIDSDDEVGGNMSDLGQDEDHKENVKNCYFESDYMIDHAQDEEMVLLIIVMIK